jgi:hypothetical protein
MDNAGWHAQRRAEKVCVYSSSVSFPRLKFTQESALYRNLPIENVAPIGESYIGGLPFSSPPPLPPKDHLYTSSNYDKLESQPSQSTISTSRLTHMTAVERSKALRVARTEPYLQVSPLLIHRALSLTSPILKFMCGPLLK